MEDAFSISDQSTSHVLRPHHVGLLAAVLLSRTRDPEPYSNGFLLHLHRVLLVDISEVCKSRPFPALIREIAAYSPSGELLEVRRFAASLAGLPRHLNTAEKFADFFTGSQEQERRSLFGLFTRRCHHTFLKMNFESVDRLRTDFYVWAVNQNRTTYPPMSLDAMSERFLLQTPQDEKRHSQFHDFQLFERNIAKGDMVSAERHLRDFFIQRFTSQPDSPVRQIPLLHLGQMHFMWGEWDAARKVLLECISVCRTNGDKATLHYSTLLLRRLPPETGSQPVMTVVQEHTPALDVLYDVKKVLDAGLPLSIAFERVVEAAASADLWVDKPEGRPPPSLPDCQWANHGVQAILWRAAGQEMLAQTEENIAMCFARLDSEDDTMLSARLGRARQYARQGQIEDALVTLLDPPAWATLSLRQYTAWAAEVWNVLMVHLSRRGQKRQYDEFFCARQPSRDASLRSFFNDVPGTRQGALHEALQRCMESRRLSTGPMGLEPLLRSIGQAKATGQWALYRVGIILLADLELDLGLTSTSREMLEECLPQLMLGEDLEQRAYACFTFARCLLVESKGAREAIMRAVPFLQVAETDYAHIQLHAALERTQYMLAVVSHNLGPEYYQQRDEAAARRLATTAEATKWVSEPLDEQFKEAMDLVLEVGIVVAAR
ncbi:hypothetical protein BKA62DRAFT_742251 [Auriculariales sp. MPI-PUGE-AT-0066]|nr:hypothetical protein BKA62DRAFT_742251 [Auriculariales sp. MPI-PUGE-AT-0066]